MEMRRKISTPILAVLVLLVIVGFAIFTVPIVIDHQSNRETVSITTGENGSNGGSSGGTPPSSDFNFDTDVNLYSTIAHAILIGSSGVQINGQTINGIQIKATVSGKIQGLTIVSGTFTVIFKVGATNYTIATQNPTPSQTSPFFQMTFDITKTTIIAKVSAPRNTKLSLVIYVDGIINLKGVYSGQTYQVKLSSTAFTGTILIWEEKGSWGIYYPTSPTNSNGGTVLTYSLLSAEGIILIIILIFVLSIFVFELFPETKAKGRKVAKKISRRVRRRGKRK